MVSEKDHTRLLTTAQTALRMAEASLREAQEALKALAEDTREADNLHGYTLADFDGLTTAQSVYKINDAHPHLKNGEIARIIVKVGKSATCTPGSVASMKARRPID